MSVLKVGPLSSNAGPSNLHPMVRLEDAGTGALPRLHMNSKPVPWDELGDILTNEIKVGPDWIVYVQADENVLRSDVINAMDIIRGSHARIVLLTTKIANLPHDSSEVPLRPSRRRTHPPKHSCIADSPGLLSAIIRRHERGRSPLHVYSSPCEG